MRLLLENLPSSLRDQRDTLARCLEAMGRVQPIHAVYLFGSHARGTARPDSDVDLCIVADGAERQIETATRFREAIWDIWPRPALTLIPITPQRLAEKRAIGDHFFATILEEGLPLATQNYSSNPGDWIFFAESEVQGLETLAERELSYPMCQSKLAEVLEKVLKAELIRLGWFLERTHDLEMLANELESHRSDLAERVRPLCTSLAEVYFSGRYPGFDLDDPDWPSFREKLQAVKEAIALVKNRLS